MAARFIEDLSPGELQALNFAAMAMAVLIAAAVAWLLTSYQKKKRKRKRKHHGHDRINPTRAELGGLPPPRSKLRQSLRKTGDGESPFDP